MQRLSGCQGVTRHDMHTELLWSWQAILETGVLLQIGWPGGAQLSDAEQRAHFALWAILKSPLIFGNDLG